MDCLVVMPAGDRGSSWHSSPGYSGLPVAQTPPACVVGSPLVRSTMFLPRLCSIPEAAEHSSTACDESAYAADTALAAALTAGCAPGSSSSVGGSLKPSAADAAVVNLAQCSSTQQEASRDDCSSQQISGCSSKLSGDSVQEVPSCSSARADEGMLASDGVMQVLSPAVVASTWAISIRHFQDCLPISADSVCSSSTCHTVSMRGSGDAAAGASSSQAPCFLQEPSSSNSQQQQDTQGQQAASSCSVPHSSSSSSLLPAADDDGVGPSAASLLAALSMQDMDPTEWQPWDRVARWLDTHGAEGSQLTGTTSSSSVQACSSSSLQGMEGLQPSTTQQQHQQHQQEAHQQPEQDGSNDAEPLFDAPDWWQESVRARLEEQREAFQSSWWCRLKMLTGLAAQRAASSL